MMKVIMLVGRNNCGKTTTLNMVYQDVLKTGGISTGRTPLGDQKPATPQNFLRNDFSDTVTFQGKTVTFFTMGDYSFGVTDAMTKYSNKGVHILVCACNDRFVKPLREIKNYPRNIIYKTLASATTSEQEANTDDAKKIYSDLAA